MSSPVASAVLARRSTRKFLGDKPVSEAVIRELLSLAKHSPSGGNVQPWQVHVVSGEARNELVRRALESAPTGGEYEIYPNDIADPFLRHRTECTMDMYATMGIARTDRAAKLAHVQRNFALFDAPVGIFFTLKKYMGAPQFSDVGMFMQTFMLLCEERGLATCAQEAWSNHSALVKEFLEISEEEDLLFCAIAVGYADPTAPVNTLRTTRAGVEEFCTFKSKI